MIVVPVSQEYLGGDACTRTWGTPAYIDWGRRFPVGL